MMTLFDLLTSAQNGAALRQMSRQFGLDQDQCEQAMRALLPAFATGLKRSTETMEGLTAFLETLAGGPHSKHDESSDLFAAPDAQADGNAILGQLFGSPDVSRAVAEAAARQSGIAADILKAMLPYMAMMIMGALFRQARDPISAMLGEMMAAQAGMRPDSRTEAARFDNPFAPLAEMLMKGGGALPGMPGFPGMGGRSASGTEAPSAMDLFAQMFDAGPDGSAMDDIFDAFLGGHRPGGRKG